MKNKKTQSQNIKNPLTRIIMEHLIICVSKFAIKALYTPYGHRLTSLQRDIDQIHCTHDFSRWPQNTASVALCRLKKRGLVANNGPKRKTIWCITKKGQTHFEKTRKLELPIKDGKMRLVVFDIPEEERRKRIWLRAKLLSCDYSRLQRSVWIGTRPLPEWLLKEMKNLNLMSYVYIVGLEGVEK